MSEVEIIHNPRCSKSRQTLELLTAKGFEPKITEYLKAPLSIEDINAIAQKLGLKPSEFVRKGEFAKIGIQMAETDAALIEQMHQHPILIERPIVIKGKQAKIGRPPESVLDIL